MYLANDVIQNSKKKGPEYGKEFGKILKNAFLHIGETCTNDGKTLGSLGRILKIWEDRGVYEEKAIHEYRNALNKVLNAANGENKNTSVTVAPNKASSSGNSNGNSATTKRKSEPATASENGKGKETNKKSKNINSSSSTKERGKRETIEVNGAIETHVILSPKAPAGT